MECHAEVVILLDLNSDLPVIVLLALSLKLSLTGEGASETGRSGHPELCVGLEAKLSLPLKCIRLLQRNTNRFLGRCVASSLSASCIGHRSRSPFTAFRRNQERSDIRSN